jgi:probable F420-dependent oxidoreductase
MRHCFKGRDDNHKSFAILATVVSMLIDSSLRFAESESDTSPSLIEEEGFDGVWTAESTHDPLITLALAARDTNQLALGTGILVAFGRSPMVTALAANDVHLVSRGRLMLGLGSQIKPHIEKRYSMPWSQPAARMREYVMALRAIWSAWNDEAELDFRGDFYTHTLMTPFFRPLANQFGTPKVFIAGVGERMTEVAGEVADGFLVHPFTTERYLREVTLPALDRGLAKSGRTRADLQISYAGLVATGGTEEEHELATSRVRSRIGFYASTPAYRKVLELHGWGDLQPELHLLTKNGGWSDLKALIPNEVMNAFSVVASIDDVAPEILGRFGDVVDRFTLGFSTELDPAFRSQILTGLRP